MTNFQFFSGFHVFLFVNLLKRHLRELSRDENQLKSAHSSSIHSLVRNCCIAAIGTVVSDLITVLIVVLTPNDTILLAVSSFLTRESDN